MGSIGNEGAPTALRPEINAEFDPVVFVQEQLGVDEETARGLMNVIVECPVPGVVAEPQAMGVFLTSPRGREMAPALFRDAKQELEQDQTLVRALRFAFGRAISIDAKGELVKMAPPAEIQIDPKEVLKKNEDKKDVEVVAETVEVKHTVDIKNDSIEEAVIDVAAQLEVRMPEVTPPEVAAQLARERVENELARQILQAEVAMSERLAAQEIATANAAASKREAEIIPLTPRIVNASENVVIPDIAPEISNRETVEIAELVETQTDEQVGAEIIYLDDFRVVDEFQLDNLSNETGIVAADGTEAVTVDEGNFPLAEIVYPEVWRDEPVVELEPLTVADFAKELRELTVGPNADVESRSDPQIELTPEMVAVNEQVATALEALVEPEKIAEAQDLLDEIMEAVQSFTTIPKIEAEAAEKNLKQLCEELFEFLHIEYNDEMIQQFMRSMLFVQEKRLATARSKRQQQIVDQGTRERDRHLQASFRQQILQDDTQPEQFGHVTLMVS